MTLLLFLCLLQTAWAPSPTAIKKAALVSEILHEAYIHDTLKPGMLEKLRQSFVLRGPATHVVKEKEAIKQCFVTRTEYQNITTCVKLKQVIGSKFDPQVNPNKAVEADSELEPVSGQDNLFMWRVPTLYTTLMITIKSKRFPASLSMAQRASKAWNGGGNEADYAAGDFEVAAKVSAMAECSYHPWACLMSCGFFFDIELPAAMAAASESYKTRLSTTIHELINKDQNQKAVRDNVVKIIGEHEGDIIKHVRQLAAPKQNSKRSCKESCKIRNGGSCN